MKYVLAIDIGASSGRHIVGWMENGEIRTKEVYRFPNAITDQNGHLVWDTESLVSHVKKGILEAQMAYPVESMAVDTWGVGAVPTHGNPVSALQQYIPTLCGQARRAARGRHGFSDDAGIPVV